MKTQIFRIVFEDESLLIIEKQQPFLSQRADRGQGEGLDEFVSRQLGIKIFPVHRLDREVLGLMIYARSSKIAEALSLIFKNREIKKVYEAVVRGKVSKDQDTLVHYLKKNQKTNYVTVFTKPTPEAKRAELTYQVIDRDSSSTRLLISLKTGRSHQIRVQLAKIGHPILGDFRYGKKNSDDESTEDSIHLRSVFLSFTHPSTGENVSASLIDEGMIEKIL
ncbi:MAG: RluA family pseudouridine synthase [Deltaproteobacteria bacterium]|nr:RluA family pseudouridine synthase [Deltaproteobacteria bacterium]